MKRTKMLRVRFSDNEYSGLERLAENAGMSMSELVRDHVGKLRITNRQDAKERMKWLNRINSNLNMIAKWVNTHKSFAESAQVLEHLISIDREVKKMCDYKDRAQ